MVIAFVNYLCFVWRKNSNIYQKDKFVYILWEDQYLNRWMYSLGPVLVVWGKPLEVTIFAHSLVYEPRQANLCLRAFRHDKF